MDITKWYFDLVSASGQTFIGYGVVLNLFHVRIPWRACFLWEGEKTFSSQGIGRFQAGQTHQGNTFHIPAQPLTGRWSTSVATESHHLIQQPSIHICWQGISLAADARLTFYDRTIVGKGYVECLKLSLLRPHLPFNKLHWGRFIAHYGQHHLVWIQFDGPYAITLVFDGYHYDSEARISPQGLVYAHGSLALNRKHTLVDTSIATHIPRLLKKCLGGSASNGQEMKWLSSGRLKVKSGETVDGWVIHEEVTW